MITTSRQLEALDWSVWVPLEPTVLAPPRPGVYLFRMDDGAIRYVGSTTVSLRRRLRGHANGAGSSPVLDVGLADPEFVARRLAELRQQPHTRRRVSPARAWAAAAVGELGVETRWLELEATAVRGTEADIWAWYASRPRTAGALWNRAPLRLGI